jgi:hypothetical protein
MSIHEVFKTNRPHLSVGSLKTYSSIITNLGRQMKKELDKPEHVIDSYKSIIEHLKDVEPKCRKTRLAALIVFIEKEKDKKEADEAFRELMTEDAGKTSKEIDEQTLTDRQKEGMMKWSEIQALYNDLEKEVTPLMKRASLDKRQFEKCQLYVLLSCLLLIPPRRSLDYAEFKIRNIDEAKDNFMKLEKKVPYFVFNVYKTANKYKQQREEVPKKLQKIITDWAKLNPHEYLLMNTRQNGKINSSQLTNVLHTFFGKPISTSLLRHIYLSEKYKNIPALKDMKETAEAMSHSVLEALKYIKH